MARTSEPISTHLGQTQLWQSNDYGLPAVYIFLQDYWLSLSLWKLFEIARDRITILANTDWKKYWLITSILLLIAQQHIVRKRQKILKKRILFILFRRFIFRRYMQWKNSQWPEKYRGNYNKIENFILETKKRFLSYCELTSKKFGKKLLDYLLKTKLFIKINKIPDLKLPFYFNVKNLFSVMDRSYLYIWRYFYKLICNNLWYAKKMRYFISTIKICFMFLFLPKAQLLANHLAYLLKKSRKHWQIIKTVTQIFTLMPLFSINFDNFKIRIKGCIQDSERTRSISLGKNNVVMQRFSLPIDYAIAHAATPFGALGIKVWIINKYEK